MHRDIKLLSEIYTQTLIKEDPDTFETAEGFFLPWNDKKAVPFFTWRNQYVFAKVFGTAHNALFSKAVINAYVNLPLDASKNDVAKSGLNWDNATFNANSDFIEDLRNNDGFSNLQQLDHILGPAYIDSKKNLVTFQEFWATAIADVGRIINTLRLRGYLTPCGRAWIAPDHDPSKVFVSFWPSEGKAIEQRNKEATKKAIAGLIKKFPAAFSIRPGYTFEVEGGEENFDPGKLHIETDPKKRREQLLAKGVKPGSSKEGEVAAKAGYPTAAAYKDVRRQGLGDSYQR